MLKSIEKHDKNSFKYVLSLDHKTENFLDHTDVSGLKIIKINELEESFPNLQIAKKNRSKVEYYWTLTPLVLYYIIFKKHFCSSLTYLDADQLFFSSPDIVFNEFKNADIVIMPHRFPKQLKYLENHGIYNVSWLTFNNSDNSKRCLKWWSEACIEWCYGRVEGNKYGDQKYLDQFPKLFKNVHIIKNEACGLAPWNISEYDYRENLILFHYQSLRRVTDWLYTISLPSTNKSALNKIKPYLKKVIEALNSNSQEISISDSDKSILMGEDSTVIIKFSNLIIFLKRRWLVKIFFGIIKKIRIFI